MEITLTYYTKDSKERDGRRCHTTIMDIPEGTTIDAILKNLDIRDGGLSRKASQGDFAREVLTDGMLQNGTDYLIKGTYNRVKMERHVKRHFPNSSTIFDPD